MAADACLPAQPVEGEADDGERHFEFVGEHGEQCTLASARQRFGIALDARLLLCNHGFTALALNMTQTSGRA